MGRILQFGIVLMVIAVISSGLLAFINGMTKEMIVEMDKKTENIARREAFSAAVSFNENNKKKYAEMEYIPAYDNAGKNIGYVVSIDTPGYGPSIKFVMGIDTEGKITGVRIVDASKETPGLGSKITSKKWQDMWRGRDKTYEFKKEVDAFAGATISPRGVYYGIKKGLKGFEAISSEGEKRPAAVEKKQNIVDNAMIVKAKDVIPETLACGPLTEMNGVKYYPCINGEEKTIGYMAYAEGDGYSGPIKCRVGIDISGKISRVIIENIGDNVPEYNNGIQDEKWLSHWIGKDKTYNYTKETDGVAGATISPKAVYSAIKSVMDGFEKIKGGGV